ncbi:MAG: hypothetical protein KDK53_22180, partial [Maritimibacter sp.]|nr:hypothetical protein [Maritimibacter sp.]
MRIGASEQGGPIVPGGQLVLAFQDGETVHQIHDDRRGRVVSAMASLRPGEAGMSIFEEAKRRFQRWDMRFAVDEVAGQ